MVHRQEVESCLQALLRPELFKDYGPNGFQVEGRPEVRRLCTGCREAWTADDDTLQAMAAQYLESSSSNTHEARAAQIERWRKHYGNETGDITLEELVAHVVIHELGHHFGWSDDGIEAINDAED